MINVNKIEKLLEKEFEFLIHDFGYTLDRYVYLTEIYLTYSTKKREVQILYDGINHGFYVKLINMGII
ncbi:MAG: hypothetical protein CVV25_04045 [Ignavibacteriae bacterium HGW-Ignavibacteriae-4]|jgi:hypothetical protein|nr:MAG: hypothetical protein CVV25_04045 [Ignavibacteriae bacterium HGW-Ignavibacteriae-4]